MCWEKSVLHILFMYSVSMLPEPLLWFEWSPTFCTLMYEGISTISAVKIFTENMWIIIHELCVYVSRNSPLVWLRSHIHHEHFVHVSRSPPLVLMMSHILYILIHLKKYIFPNNHLLSYSAILLLYLSPPPGTASGQVLGTASFPSQSRLISNQ